MLSMCIFTENGSQKLPLQKEYMGGHSTGPTDVLSINAATTIKGQEADTGSAELHSCCPTKDRQGKRTHP